MMNIINRAFKNVVKVPGRSIMLGIVLLIVTVFVLFGISIQAGTEQSILGARRSLGNEVRLIQNPQAAQQKLMQSLTGSGGGTVAKAQTSYVTENLGQKLTGSKYVVDYDFHLEMTSAGDIEPFSYPDTGSSSTKSGNNVQIIGQNSSSTEKTPKFRLIGDTMPEMQPDFANGTNKLLEGRFYTEDDVNSNPDVAVISNTLAEQDHLTVGSTFTVEGTNSDETAKLTVIGIYQTGVRDDFGLPSSALSAMPLTFLGDNKIYTTFPVAQKVCVKNVANIPQDYVSSVIYHIDDPINLDAFKSEAKSNGIDLDEFSLDANDSTYQKMIGPMQKLSDFARVGVISVLIAGAVIMALIMTITTRERKYEVGILRSLGANRISVALQFAAEALIICIIALAIGGAVGGVTSQSVANSMLKSEVAVQQQDEQGQSGIQIGGKNIAIIGQDSNVNSDVKALDEVNVVITANQLMELGLVGIIMVIFGCLASTYWIMKYEPMKILSNRS